MWHARARPALWLLLLCLCVPPAQAEDEPGTFAGKNADWWIARLTDRDSAVAARAALLKIGKPALEPLGKALLSTDPQLSNAAARTLGYMRADVTPLLGALVFIAPNDPRVMRTLLTAIGRDASHRVRRAALNGYTHALWQCGDHAIEPIAKALATADTPTRVALLGVLARFRERASRVRDRVRPLL